eukprot:2391114-Rhodomonas_salina.1
MSRKSHAVRCGSSRRQRSCPDAPRSARSPSADRGPRRGWCGRSCSSRRCFRPATRPRPGRRRCGRSLSP